MPKTTKQAVTYLTRELLNRKVLVDIHQSKTTSSFYLLFDNGVLKAARVGDHPGKSKYRYTYEVGKHIKHYSEINSTFGGAAYTQYRYQTDDLDAMVTQILVLRSTLKLKYGEASYQQFTKRVKQGPFENSFTELAGEPSGDNEMAVLKSAQGKLRFLTPDTALETL